MRHLKNKSKSLVSLMLVFMLVLSTMIPVWADETAAKVSKWAIPVLAEGEKYEIYPMEWYYNQFDQQITEVKLDALVDKVDDKIDFVADKVATFKPVKEMGKLDRRDVLTRLYNVLGSYNLTTQGDAVEFMKSVGIVKGTDKGLELEKACNSEQAVIFATQTIQHAYDELNAGGKGVFWKVESNGNTVYLLGSVHMANSTIYPLSDEVMDAFYASDVLYVEANISASEEDIQYFMNKATYSDGTTLKNHVTPALYEKFVSMCKLLELDATQLEIYKPWFISNQVSAYLMTLSNDDSAATNQAGLGIDNYFIEKSMLTAKPVDEMEGVQFQADMFDNLSSEYQVTSLEALCDSIIKAASGDASTSTATQDTQTDATSSANILNTWLEYWRTGNLKDFQESFSSQSGSGDDEFSKMLFGKRDIGMADKIDAMLKAEGKHTYFVVVGSGHYINKGSVVDILRSKGYTVQWMYE